jgi:hypothetical protein
MNLISNNHRDNNIYYSVKKYLIYNWENKSNKIKIKLRNNFRQNGEPQNWYGEEYFSVHRPEELWDILYILTSIRSVISIVVISCNSLLFTISYCPSL